jgi:hypothetical protein
LPNVFGLFRQCAEYAAPAALALSAWSCAVAAKRAPRRKNKIAGPLSWALLLGVAASVVHAIFLATRLVQIGIETVVGYARDSALDFGFGPWGIWNNLILLTACGVAGFLTRDPRLFGCAIWLSVMTGVWAAALIPPTQRTTTGGFERTGSILMVISVLAATLGASALAVSQGRWPARAQGSPRRSTAPPCPSLPPGVAISAVILSTAIGLLSWYQFLVPCQGPSGGHRLAIIGVVAALVLASLSCFVLLESGGWSPALADAFVGLASLAVGGLVMFALPSSPGPMADRYPMLFTTIIFGFTTAAAICATICDSAEFFEPGPARRLAAHSRRFVFFNAVVAFLAATMMTVWPRLAGIAAMDDSFGRVTTGCAANLTLLLVMLWVSRKLRHPTLHVLTVLVLCSTAGFLAARVLPFASHIH